ncbi:MAG: SMP-30/gluconolactonase/LRE family protein [Deltaproteobacteria bacterium]|nr:SMP-30/gluconolactonase/LRE family protein [Deltaproteobacteria bacterium]MBW2419563.1 SMP-30/gluconolactonase/LRE family protein [Deltaproteobacteria bacterium]
MSTAHCEVETLVTGYGLVEGPRVDAENRLYFSDARLGGVYCRAPGGEIETVIPKRRGVGGIALHAAGGIVVSGKNICHVRDGVSRIVFELEDVPGFNDLFTDSQGRILVGSQRYSPFAKDAEVIPGELYRIGSEGKAETLYDDVGLTNGIGFSPDGRRLYHSDSARNQVLVHDVAEDGAVTNRRVFVELPRGAPDGLAVDEEGCVWVAAFGAGGVTRFTPAGDLERHLEVPARGVASVCFGGSDLRDLYVATADKSSEHARGGSIFRTRAPAPGLAVPLARV